MAQTIVNRLTRMKVGETETDWGDQTTYVVRTSGLTWAVCDNGEEIKCRSHDEAARIVRENVKANNAKK